MTREEMIEHIQFIKSCAPISIFHVDTDVLDTVIEILMQEPKTGHCKDCKHMRYWSHPFGRTIECSKDILICPTDNDFCSRYERR